MKRKVSGFLVFLMAISFWSIPNVAFALYRDDGDEPGEPLSGATIALVFVGVPVAVGLITTLLVLAPGWFRKNAREFSSLTPSDPIFMKDDSGRKSISS
jgi:hypothetical protein